VPPGEAEAVIPESGSPIEPKNGEAFSTGEPIDESDSGGSVLGSIIAGLICGGILFAIGYGPYKRWQATRGRPPAPVAPTPSPAPESTPPRYYGQPTPPPINAAPPSGPPRSP